ncbi:hypothetical protein ACFTY7_32190 [Streptomyces sp. NPDC057062]|uniref:hypothetical protein n=1 Tax=unclassified Streptomyces TaxID=2593676 RepID=UPI0020767E6F|nr:hypothetical protein [Streptomyces sp. MBT84]
MTAGTVDRQSPFFWTDVCTVQGAAAFHACSSAAIGTKYAATPAPARSAAPRTSDPIQPRPAVRGVTTGRQPGSAPE